VIEQAIAGDLQLRSGSETGTAFFRNLYRLYNSLSVALPVHDPLVETACCYGEKSAHVDAGRRPSELPRVDSRPVCSTDSVLVRCSDEFNQPEIV
jgi:hypothetical protein